MNTLIIIIFFAIISGVAFAGVYFFTPLNIYLQPFLVSFSELLAPLKPYIEMAKPYITNPALLGTLIPIAAGLVYAYIKSRAQAQLEETKLRAQSEIQNMQMGLMQSANQAGQYQEESKSLRAKLDAQNLNQEEIINLKTALAKKETQLQEAMNAKIALERALAQKTVIVEERVH